jgi:hypothetical protein
VIIRLTGAERGRDRQRSPGRCPGVGSRERVGASRSSCYDGGGGDAYEDGPDRAPGAPLHAASLARHARLVPRRRRGASRSPAALPRGPSTGAHGRVRAQGRRVGPAWERLRQQPLSATPDHSFTSTNSMPSSSWPTSVASWSLRPSGRRLSITALPPCLDRESPSPGSHRPSIRMRTCSPWRAHSLSTLESAKRCSWLRSIPRRYCSPMMRRRGLLPNSCGFGFGTIGVLI